jgi:ABC-type transport system involved in cytochrome bd biosynthesis fused ATPase/permease subunit
LGLDIANERAIWAQLHAAARATTVLAIACWLSTLVDTDQKLVREAGRVTERGPLARLMARRALCVHVAAAAEEEVKAEPAGRLQGRVGGCDPAYKSGCETAF